MLFDPFALQEGYLQSWAIGMLVITATLGKEYTSGQSSRTATPLTATPFTPTCNTYAPWSRYFPPDVEAEHWLLGGSIGP